MSTILKARTIAVADVTVEAEALVGGGRIAMRLAPIALAVLALCASPAAAQWSEGQLASTYVPPNEGVAKHVLYFHDVGCGSEWGECVAGSLSCDDSGAIGMQLWDFSDADIARWLTDNGARTALPFAAGPIEFSPVSIAFNQMNGSWDVEFAAWGVAIDGLATLPDEPALAVPTAKGDYVLPRAGKDRSEARKFLKACGG